MFKKIYLKHFQYRMFLALMIVIMFTLCIFSGCIKNEDSKSNDKVVVNISYKDMNFSLDLAEKWMISNLKEEGYFNYIYDPEEDEYSDKNNMIRQLMASRLIAEMCQTNSSLNELHVKNLDYIFKNWYREDNETYGFIYFNEESNLGAISMFLRTLIYSPFFESYSENATKLVDTILYLQNDTDGSFEPSYIEPIYDYDKNYLLNFYSGEAILGLIEMYVKTNDTIYLDASIQSQNFYREIYVEQIKDNYHPAYVPWHTITLNLLYKITGNETYANDILVLNDKLLEIQETENISSIGRFYNDKYPEYGPPHSSSDGIYTEGLAYAYEIAKLINDSAHIEKFKTGIILGIYNLINLQYNNSDEKINGAIRYNYDDYRIRLDNTQHTVDTFRKINYVFDEGWEYIYDSISGKLFDYSKDEDEIPRDSIWYALGIGTIISIILLFIIYLVVRKKSDT